MGRQLQRRRFSAWMSIVLVIGLLLAACGQVPSGSGPGGGMDRQEQPTSNPDTSISSDTPAARPPEPARDEGRGGLVQGQVTDAAGQPLAGVLVVPESTDTPPQAVPEIAVMTDDRGRYQWTLAAGHYRLVFTREGYAPVSQMITVKPDQPATLDVQMQPQ
jgi:hypothetical protein